MREIPKQVLTEEQVRLINNLERQIRGTPGSGREHNEKLVKQMLEILRHPSDRFTNRQPITHN